MALTLTTTRNPDPHPTMPTKHLTDYCVPNVPEGTAGPWTIDSFTVTEAEARIHRLRCAVQGMPGRAVCAGTFKRLRNAEAVVMSDTPAEIRDHLPLFTRMKLGQRVLIHGLGIGCAVEAGIQAGVDTIDVVERDADIIALVGDYYRDRAAEAGTLLNIHRGDALTFRFPAGQRWDLAWHDIWTYISEDNLPEMATLHRRYGSRVGWQGSWARPECEGLRAGYRYNY